MYPMQYISSIWGTAVIQNDNKWEVTLDHRRLKTPNGNVLTVGNEPLARAVAVEWDSQNETISQATMHLVRAKLINYSQ
ncbi:ATP synthase mitochondrial F1 complex assembly factor 2-like isoform X2 [Bombyx mandarina]|uniref:ATP synthase mitochondrial F1 complex assembly factor 2-like isoform X2 n=1 Tax=Bombyx mandarina TaxID=7092 RepID=A0A6J2JZJ9_BOMMA|nr:ATP synthase mitochondrial F1 complex assembly factor 2-like isoform X2 [Bombyx mandarina]